MQRRLSLQLKHKNMSCFASNRLISSDDVKNDVKYVNDIYMVFTSNGWGLKKAILKNQFFGWEKRRNYKKCLFLRYKFRSKNE
jgi:hypothetical protein